MDTFQFLKAEGKFKFNVERGIGIMGQLIMFMKTEFGFIYSQSFMPFVTNLFPVFKPFHFFTRSDKILHLHLLEFPHAEDELPSYDLITESFANLGNTKWQFHPACVLNVEVIDK